MAIAIGVTVSAAFLALWYAWALRINRRRANEVVRWIESALAGQGHVTGIQWLAPSRIAVPLKFGAGVFRQAAVVVQLPPREIPFRWLLGRLRRQQETLTFQADLDLPPQFSLEVQNHRWFARTNRKLLPDSESWRVEQTGPYVLTTRMEWQREINSVVNSLMTCRQREFDKIVFRKRSPHFSATVPLDAIAPGSQRRLHIFDSLKELATGASAASY